MSWSLIEWWKDRKEVVVEATHILETIVIVAHGANEDTTNHTVGQMDYLCLEPMASEIAIVEGLLCVNHFFLVVHWPCCPWSIGLQFSVI